MKTTTNTVTNLKFDFDKLDQMFDFFMITKDDVKKPYSKILDEPLLSDKVVAIQYTGGPSFVVMMKKDKCNKKYISDILENYNTEHDGTLRLKTLDVYFEGYEHCLLQLLLNSLSKSKTEENLSNLGGKLYYFCKKTTSQIICVEVKIDKRFNLSLNAKTFTKKLAKESKEREYILQANNTLRLKTKEDKRVDTYIDFQFANTKNEVKFLDFGTIKGNSDCLKKFYASKIGVLYRVLDRFKKKFGDLVQFQFEETDGWERLEANYAASQKNKHIKFLQSFYSDKDIHIVDAVKTKESSEIANSLKKILESYINPHNVQLSDTLSNSGLNIHIIHNKDYYETHKDEEDTHNNYTDKIVQHITLDNFPISEDQKLSANCIVILNELIVKYDLNKSSHVSFNECEHINKRWMFGLCEKDRKTDRYFFIEIQPDGQFKIGEVTQNKSGEEWYGKIKEIFDLNRIDTERHNRYDERYRGIIVNSEEGINIIQDTPKYMLPNYVSIVQQLKENKKVSKKIDSLSDTFGGCIDIHIQQNKSEDCIYYSVGQIGKGINSDIPRATHIRRIRPYENSPLFFNEVIETMNVQFVRNGQLTVMPFPFKYLREYAKMVVEG